MMTDARKEPRRTLQKLYWIVMGLLVIGACAKVQPFLVASNRSAGRVLTILVLLTPILLLGISVVAFRGRTRLLNALLLVPVVLFGVLLAAVGSLFSAIDSSLPEAVKTVQVLGSHVVMYRIDGPAGTSAPWVHVDQERSVLPGIVLVKNLATCVWVGGEDLTTIDDQMVVAELPGCGRSRGGTTQTFRLKKHVYF